MGRLSTLMQRTFKERTKLTSAPNLCPGVVTFFKLVAMRPFPLLICSYDTKEFFSPCLFYALSYVRTNPPNIFALP